MSTFDYTASAELFALRSRSGIRYQRFAQAAEAIGHAIDRSNATVVTTWFKVTAPPSWGSR